MFIIFQTTLFRLETYMYVHITFMIATYTTAVFFGYKIHAYVKASACSEQTGKLRQKLTKMMCLQVRLSSLKASHLMEFEIIIRLYCERL